MWATHVVVLTGLKGAVTEAGSSITFVRKSECAANKSRRSWSIADSLLIVGVAKANEVLLFNKKQTAQDLLECRFIKYDD